MHWGGAPLYKVSLKPFTNVASRTLAFYRERKRSAATPLVGA